MMSSRAELLGYNVKFDLRFLDREGLRLDNKVLIDVMLLVRMTAHTTVRELGLTKTIARLFSVKDSQYDKETKKILQENKWSKDYSQAPPEVLGKYCELDAYWALQIYKKCLTVVEESGQTELLNLEHSLTKVLYDMESVGITIDSSYAQEVDIKIQNRLQEVEAKIFDLSGKEFNVRSNAEIADAFHQFGIYSLGKTPKGAESWDSKSLAQINHPLAGLIRQHRALTKLLSTYIEPYLDKKILHTTFCHWGTVTGRLSSRDPNLQNIPRNHFKLQDIQLTDTQRDVIRGRIDAMASTGRMPEYWRHLATDFSTEIDPEELKKAKSQDTVKANYAATGFMLIKRECIEKIIEARPDIKYRNDIDGYMEAGDNFYDIFRCEVNPQTKKYEREDYGFCKLWKSLGGEINVVTDISLGHRGFNTYMGNLKLQSNYYTSNE